MRQLNVRGVFFKCTGAYSDQEEFLKKSLPTAFLADIRSKVEQKGEENFILLEDIFFNEVRNKKNLCALQPVL